MGSLDGARCRTNVSSGRFMTVSTDLATMYSIHDWTPADLLLMKGMLKIRRGVRGRPDLSGRSTGQDAVPEDGYLSSLLASADFIALAATDGDHVARSTSHSARAKTSTTSTSRFADSRR